MPEAAEVAEVERFSRALLTVSMTAMEDAGVELRPLGMRALLEISDAGSRNVRELAASLSLSPSATSRLVDRLVGLDLVDRQQDPADRRQVVLTPTTAGRQAVTRLVRSRRRAISRVMSALEPDDRERLRAGLEAFARGAQQDR